VLVIVTGNLEQYALKERKEGRKKESRFRKFELLKPQHNSMIRRQPAFKRILKKKKGN
jgi:hypothetical protein